MLILASTSPYRRELLQRLRLPFDCARPEVDETPLRAENPAQLARPPGPGQGRGGRRPPSRGWVIGSDQAAEIDGQILGKPGDRATAIAQLSAMAGRTLRFHTAVCLHRGPHALEALDLTQVRVRRLSPVEIERYVDAEQPLDCAGSFKCEGWASRSSRPPSSRTTPPRWSACR